MLSALQVVASFALCYRHYLYYPLSLLLLSGLLLLCSSVLALLCLRCLASVPAAISPTPPLAELHTVFDHLDEIVFQVDAQGCWSFLSQPWETLTGFAIEETLGKELVAFLHTEDRQQARECLHTLLGQQQPLCSYEARYLTKDYRLKHVAMRAYPLTNAAGHSIGVAGILTDLSEHQRFAHELAIAQGQALEAARLKSEFLATMSHEIRTPMNGIIGMSDLLLETSLSEEQHEFAVIINEASHALLAILNDILDFSRIEAGKLTLNITDFELVPLIEGVVHTLAAKARKKDLVLSTFVAPELPSRLQGDAMRLRQVLINLVDNAIKFTERGEVSIRIIPDTESESHSTANFIVRDTGIGLSQAITQRLFQPFTQADSSATRRYGGTGLGLAISRRLVEIMGGEIGVESVEGQGSVFWFTACFERSPLLLSKPTESPNTMLDARILLVGSTLPNRELLHQHLLDKHMRVSLVASSSEALATLRAAAAHRPYDMVLVDAPLDSSDAQMLGQAMQHEPILGQAHCLLLLRADDAEHSRAALAQGFRARCPVQPHRPRSSSASPTSLCSGSSPPNRCTSSRRYRCPSPRSAHANLFCWSKTIRSASSARCASSKKWATRCRPSIPVWKRCRPSKASAAAIAWC
ncbi:MAG: PAS domain-containing protein [Blastochloris sp.]|nr:PAS domain-containing protein [Blastochloris sp.]